MIYVLIGSDDMNLINGAKGSLCDKFKVKDLGNLSYFWVLISNLTMGV